MYIYMCVYMYTCICILTYKYMCVYTCICMYACTHVYMYMYIYIHIYNPANHEPTTHYTTMIERYVPNHPATKIRPWYENTDHQTRNIHTDATV